MSPSNPGAVEAMACAIVMAVEGAVFTSWCELGWQKHEIDTNWVMSILRSHGITDEMLASARGRELTGEATSHPDSPEAIVIRDVAAWFRCRFNERSWWLQDELIRIGWRDGINVCFWMKCEDVKKLGIRGEKWTAPWYSEPQWRWTIVPKTESKSEVTS